MSETLIGSYWGFLILACGFRRQKLSYELIFSFMSNRGEIAVRGKWLWVTYSFSSLRSDTLSSNLLANYKAFMLPSLTCLWTTGEGEKNYAQPQRLAFFIYDCLYFVLLFLSYSCICPYLSYLLSFTNLLKVAIQGMMEKGEEEENVIKAENWNWKMRTN